MDKVRKSIARSFRKTHQFITNFDLSVRPKKIPKAEKSIAESSLKALVILGAMGISHYFFPELQGVIRFLVYVGLCTVLALPAYILYLFSVQDIRIIKKSVSA